jgi:hypothetical protein
MWVNSRVSSGWTVGNAVHAASLKWIFSGSISQWKYFKEGERIANGNSGYQRNQFDSTYVLEAPLECIQFNTESGFAQFYRPFGALAEWVSGLAVLRCEGVG